MHVLDAMRAAAWLLRYSLGAADQEDALVTIITAMKGRRESELVIRSETFYQRVLRRQIRPGARDAVDFHRRRGDKLVLLTSSSTYLSQLIARELGLDDYLCTKLEVDANGIFTGRPLGRPCFGAGKLVAALLFIKAAGVALDDCTFYTDSASDLPVLAAVGNPVAVNPDLRLRWIAKTRGWSIVDWGRP